MPGKFTDGYTKKSQQNKFIRHRDVKMKDSELRKEQKTQKLMCEGICRRCREKVQWRFKYDKYKPLKAVATCQQCKQKKVTKAYRTLCDGCASTKDVCPSCCLTPEQTERLDEEEEQKQLTSTSSGDKKESY
jgi:ferredoxin